MAYVRQMWLNSGMSGRADKTSNVYTKINSITGKTFAVMLRNPLDYDKLNNEQKQHCNVFGALSNGVSLWLAQCKATDADAADKAVYEKLAKRLRAQHKYATLRGLVMAKYASVNEALTTISIKVDEYEKEISVTFMARPIVDGAPSEEFEGGSNGGSSEGSNGSEQGNGGSSQTPSQPAQGASETPAQSGDFTITAAVGNDGGGSVTIKKNGVAVEGSNVQASATDTVTLTAVEDSGYQFLGWADGNSDNPRTITPSADATFTASFMDLSNV